MAQSILPSRTLAPFAPALAAILGIALLGVVLVEALVAQIAGERGIAPVAASSDIQVSGIPVDIRASSAEEARETGWREAQKEAWQRLNGPNIADSQLESLVSAIVIEEERIAPGRYIASLGVIFDRSRASQYLGGGGAQQRRSAPMLVIPVTFSAGSQTVFEMRNPWQRAWAQFQPGRSRINYVRPTGSGGDSILVNYGQTSRRSRTWWRGILDEFGAADVITPVARLEYRWPGGPVDGTFTARYGPDNRYLDAFEMSADTPAELPAMLDQAVRRLDRIYQQALAEGKLRPDPTLDMITGDADPAIARLVEIGRAIRAREVAQLEASDPTAEVTVPPPVTTPAVLRSHVVQFASPDAAAVDATLAAVRSAQGVRGAATTSLALGGTSVMTVTYGGSLDQLATALRARGFTVTQGSTALAISR